MDHFTNRRDKRRCWEAGGPCWELVSGGLPCSAMLRLGSPGEELLLLWLVLAFVPPGAGLFPPHGGNLSHMRVPTHLERLGVMPGDVPRLTPSRRTCPLVLHHSWLVAGPWSCWGRRRALSVGSKARPAWVKACTSSLGRPQRYSEWGCPEKLRGEPHHEWHEVAGTDRTDRGKRRSR